MKQSSPKSILDLYDFLPLDGEDKIELHHTEGNLNLILFYESDETKVTQKTICFNSALQFSKGLFPGYSFFSCKEDNDVSLLDSLVEYEESEFLEKSIDKCIRDDFKHYRLFLHSVGIALHVIAKSIEVID